MIDPSQTFPWATVPRKTAKGWNPQIPSTWAHLVGMLTAHDVRQKKDGELWAPVTVGGNTKSRTNDSVLEISCIVLDFDCGVTPEAALEPIVQRGLAWVGHSSHSHMLAELVRGEESVIASWAMVQKRQNEGFEVSEAAKPKFRIVVPLSRPVSAADWPGVWEWAHSRLGPDSDVACKNPARLYYLPSAPEETAFDIWSDCGQGDALDVDAILLEIEATRPAQPAAPLKPKSTGAKPTGQGDYSTLDVLAWAQAMRMKPVQEDGGEGKVYIECPWKADHTGGKQGPKDTYLLNKHDGGKPVFKCSHSHCQGRGFWAILQAIGGADEFCASRRQYAPKQRQLQAVEHHSASPSREVDPDTQGADSEVETDEALSDEIEQITQPGIRWAIKTDNGPKCGVANAIVFLRQEFGAGDVRFNEFTRLVEVNGRPIKEAAIARLIERIELASRQTNWSRGHIDSALQVLAEEAPKYHPIREYLQALSWDGVSRIAGLVHTLGMASPLEIHSRYLECFFISAVARIMDPGCKVDTALVLQGPQGARKSSFFEYLTPNREWFSDAMGGLENKDASMAVGHSWIIEWSELESVRRSNAGAVKAFLSRRVEHYRPPYGRELVDIPRSCVIVGTTNEDQFLQDTTGNRRYMVIPVGQSIDTDAINDLRDQLWAEAVVRYEYSEPWHLSQEESSQQADVNADLVAEDPWTALISRWLPRSSSFSTAGYTVSLTEVLRSCLEIPVERHSRASQMRVAQILRDLGWRRIQVMQNGRRVWLYQSPPGFREESSVFSNTDAF